jgi:hypothetical protein
VKTYLSWVAEVARAVQSEHVVATDWVVLDADPKGTEATEEDVPGGLRVSGFTGRP